VNAPAPMQKYPAYEGIYNPKLDASMHYTDKAVTISYNLTGVPCECSQMGTAANSCGLHIHEGTTCANSMQVGGHWYDNRTMTADPWAIAPYIAQKCSEVAEPSMGTTASGSLTVRYDNDYATTIMRVLVVHDYMGARIGCAPLMASGGHPTPAAVFPIVPVVIGGGAFLVLLLLIFVFCRHRKNKKMTGTLNEKLAGPTALANPTGANPHRRTLSVNHM